MLFLAALWGGLGCKSDPPGGKGPKDDDPADTDEPLDTADTEETGTAGPTGDTGPVIEQFDCSTVPAEPLSKTEIQGARGYHDVAFTENGYILGNNSGNFHLVAAAYGEPANVLVPGIGQIEQMTWLPNGDLAAATYQGVVRITPAGGQTVIAGDIHAYGLILGPDQKLYAADQSKIVRIDPDTGQIDRLLEPGALPQGSPRVIQFGLGYTQMFIGTLSGAQGRIYVMDLDENLDPISEPRIFTSGVGAGDYHDGLGIDICGYLYVPDYSYSALYRISPSGQVQNIHNSGPLLRDYGHGLEWGNGVGGWRDDAIYLPLPYGNNKVLEIVIGVPSRDKPGVEAINLP